jgi:hypothetical protein
MAAGLLILLASSLGDWGESGRQPRSSYELIRLVDRLHFMKPGLSTALARCWYAMPLAVVLALAALTTGRALAAATFACLAGAGGLALATRVERSALRIQDGLIYGRAGAMMSVLAGVALVLTRPHPRHEGDQ